MGEKATNEDGTDAELIDPEVYFTFCFSCAKDPDDLLADIRIKCRRQGFNLLEMKPLDYFDTKTIIIVQPTSKPQLHDLTVSSFSTPNLT